MTFDELDQKFPNGLVDAKITKITVDYRARVAELELNLRPNPPDAPNAQEYRQGVLTLRGFYYVSIEPPDADHLFYPERLIQVDAFPEDPGQFPTFEHLKQVLPASAFCCRFFIHDWNSFIHIASRDGQFSLVEGAP